MKEKLADWLEDKLNLGCALTFMLEKNVRLSFKIANLIMNDELRFNCAVSLMNSREAYEYRNADKHSKRYARKSYDSIIELMEKKPNYLER